MLTGNDLNGVPINKSTQLAQRTARRFAAEMSSRGIHLDFSLASLRHQVDRLLDDLDAIPEPGPAEWKKEAALGAYVGETLARLFSGRWRGTFHADSSAVSFYSSYIEFGEFRYYPSRFLAYRISNGPSQGSFLDYLENLIPKIEARLEDD